MAQAIGELGSTARLAFGAFGSKEWMVGEGGKRKRRRVWLYGVAVFWGVGPTEWIVGEDKGVHTDGDENAQERLGARLVRASLLRARWRRARQCCLRPQAPRPANPNIASSVSVAGRRRGLLGTSTGTGG